jgi:hypothetical protein
VGDEGQNQRMYEVVGCAGVSVVVWCHLLHLRDKAEPVKARPVLGGWQAAIRTEFLNRRHHPAAVAHTAPPD